MGGLGGAAERGVFGQKLEILELAQGWEHDQHIDVRYRLSNDNQTTLCPLATFRPRRGRRVQTAAAPNSSFRVTSNRSAFITLVQAATKSRTNFPPASAEA